MFYRRLLGVGAALVGPLLLGATSVPMALNNSQLRQMLSYQHSEVLRMGVNAEWDADPVWFSGQAAACAISGGDVGSQVPSGDAGCFVAHYPATGADAREWNQQPSGPVTGGVVDATTTLQAAVTYAAKNGVKLLLGPYSYLVTQTITGPGAPWMLEIDGVGNPSGSGAGCPTKNNSRIIVNSDITPFQLRDYTDIVRGVCFQMAVNPNTRTSGAALVVGGDYIAGAATLNSMNIIEDNKVANSFNGILIGGPAGSNTSGADVRRNAVVNASNIAIAVGTQSTNRGTHGVRLVQNQLVCSATCGVGYGFYDAAATLDAGDSGPYRFSIGTQILPGSGQSVILSHATGVLGDTSVTHDLVVDSAGGTIFRLAFSDCWVAQNTAGDGAVLVQDTAGGIKIGDLSFTNCSFVSNAAAQANPLIDIEGDAGSLSLTGSHFISATGTLATAIKSGGSGVGFTLTGNTTSGTITNFINLAGTSGNWTVTGNTLRGIPTPISGGFAAGSFNVIAHNLGIDDVQPTIPSAATMALPFNPVFAVSGSTTITTLSGIYKGIRPKTAVPPTAGGTLPVFGTGGNLCNALTPTAGQSVMLTYDITSNCVRLAL